MGKLTRFQAVRAAMQELGGRATHEQVAMYVSKEYGMTFSDLKALSLYMSMVNSKMIRKGPGGKLGSSRG